MTEEQKRLVEQHHNLIYWYLNKKKMSINEWYDILAIALCNAVISYDSDICEFATYAIKCFNTAVHTRIRLDNGVTKRPSGGVWSYEEKIQNPLYNEENATCELFLADGYNVEQEAIVSLILKKCLNKMSERDKKIILMLYEGYDGKEIGEKFNMSHQNVFLIKNKFKNIIKKELST